MVRKTQKNFSNSVRFVRGVEYVVTSWAWARKMPFGLGAGTVIVGLRMGLDAVVGAFVGTVVENVGVEVGLRVELELVVLENEVIIGLSIAAAVGRSRWGRT